MRVLFTVQGEGRGHMTQALAAHQFLSRSGHELVAVVVGRHPGRSLPDYVARGLPAPIHEVPSPGFVFHRGRAINLPATAWRALAARREWLAGTTRLREIAEDTRPDLILNFFEPLTGLAQLRERLPAPVVSVAHQHMIGHPAHRTPLLRLLDTRALQAFSELVGWNSWKLALSFYPARDRLRERVVVGPPLLRRQLFAMPVSDGGHCVVYLVNHGYHEEIRQWHRRRPGMEIHCYYDRPGAPDTEAAGSGLFFHRLSGERFLQHLASCRAAVTTAGFESVAEAAWLGKPLMVVPVRGHTEQHWNADDAAQAGLAVASRTFDLDRLDGRHSRRHDWFREWVGQADALFARVLTTAADSRRANFRRSRPSGRRLEAEGNGGPNGRATSHLGGPG